MFATTPDPDPLPTTQPDFHLFQLTRYSESMVIASWKGDGGRACNHTLPTPWGSLTLPVFFSLAQDSATPPFRLSLLFLDAPSGSTPSPNTSLSTSEADTLSKLTGAYQNVVDFLSQTPNPPSDAGTQSGIATETGNRTFYRVRRTLPDTDGDGLTDYQELSWNRSSAFDPDSDHDGLVDMLEDFDGDGLSNAVELGAATPPHLGQPYNGELFDPVVVGGQTYDSALFRFRPGIAHRHFYQVQQTTDFVTWSDLNAYDFAVGSPSSAGDGTEAYWMKVRATIPSSSVPPRRPQGHHH